MSSFDLLEAKNKEIVHFLFSFKQVKDQFAHVGGLKKNVHNFKFLNLFFFFFEQQSENTHGISVASKFLHAT